ncbi:MAG: FG-GAP-like repeat-containing protein [Acidobacteriota bacterium]
MPIPRFGIRKVVAGPAAMLAAFLFLWACTTSGPGGQDDDPRAGASLTQGSLEAEFSVDQRGAAVYQIPIPLPPGTAELGPELSLSYSSASGNGMLGMGFDLSGLQAIDRTSANLRQDGFKGGISYDGDDRFEMNGERLLAIASAGTTTEMRTERESWSKVVANARNESNGTCGSGPCWFSIIAKDGTRSTYGVNDDSRVEAAGGDGDVRVWALDEVTDLNGNVMRVSYTDDPLGRGSDDGQYYPASIAYTSHRDGAAAQRFVTFHYEERPDVIRQYIGGYPVVTRARLKSITAEVAGQAAPSLHLDYEAAPGTGRSRLVSVQACGGEGEVCLPPTEFDWQDQSQTFENDGSWLSTEFVTGWDIETNPRYLSDVNGDGRLDIVGFRFDTRVALAEENLRFAPASTWNDDFGTGWTAEMPREVADVNGDGRGDVVGFGLAGVQVAPSNGSRFDPSLWSSQAYPHFGRDPSAGAWIADRNPRMLNDVNGDGLADIVGFHDRTMVALSTGTSFETPRVWNESDFTGASWWVGRQQLRYLADVNGDGLADIVGFGEDGIKVGICQGNAEGGFSLQPWSQNQTGYPHFSLGQGWSAGQHPRYMADVNGDGLSDIVGFRNGVQVAFSTGDGFLDPVTWNSDFSAESTVPWSRDDPRLVLDINGDGLDDVVGFSRTGAKVAVSSGEAFLQTGWDQESLPTFTGGQPSRLLTAGDVNGDGMVDVIGFGAELTARSEITVGLVDGLFPDLVTTITNGLGGRYEIEYAPLTSSEVYTRSSDGTTSAIEGLREAAVDDDPNGLGHFTTPVPYRYDDISANFPIQEVVGGHVYVVANTRETTDPARQAARYDYQDSYHYTEAKLDLLSQRWLGFKTHLRREESLGRENLQVFHQDYPLNGRVAHTEIRCSESSPDPRCQPGALMTVDAFEWQSRVTATGSGSESPPVYEVLESEYRRDEYTYGQYDLSIGREMAYDEYGNRTLEAYLGYVDRQGRDLGPEDNVYGCSRYANLDVNGDWKLGYPLFTKQSRSADCFEFETFEEGVDFKLRRQTYDVEGGTLNELSDSQWDDRSSTYMTFAYDYDVYGNVVAATNPQGDTGTYEYDQLNTFPVRVSSPPLPEDGGNRLVVEKAFDARFGLQVLDRQPNGNLEVICPDAFGRPVTLQVASPEGKASDAACLAQGVTVPVTTTTSVSYGSDAGGGIFVRTDELQDWPTGSARDLLASWEYLDGRERTYKTVEDSSESNQIANCTVFDADDEEIESTLPFFGGLGGACSAGGGSPLWTTTERDLIGRPVRETRPNGPQGGQTVVDTTTYVDTETTEQGWDTTGPDPYRAVANSRFFDDELKVVSAVVPGDGNATSTYEFDPLGRMVAATDPATEDNPNGVTTTLEYDSLDRMVAVSSPDRGASRFDYQGTEWLQVYADGYGEQRQEYDPLGRMQSQFLPDGRRYEFQYDDPEVSRGLGMNTGWTIYDADGGEEASTTYGFDTVNEMSTETLTLAGEATAGVFTTRYDNDPQGRQRRIVFPDGAVGERRYSGGNLVELAFAGEVLAELDEYTALREPGRYRYPTSQVVEESGYYPTGQFWSHRIEAPSGPYLDTATSWDGLTRVRDIEDRLPGDGEDLSHVYRYQNLRLTEAVGANGTKIYGYDRAGNLIRAGDIDYRYRYHRIESGTSGGNEVYAAEYDDVGSMVRRASGGQVWNFEYDSLAQLRAVRGEGETEPRLTMTYDPEGIRLTKVAPTGLATLYVTPDFQVTRADGSELSTHYLGLDDGESVMAVTTGEDAVRADGLPAPGTLFLHRNHLGSTQMTTDQSGEVVNRYAYAAYGALAEAQGPNDVRPKFTGRELDSGGDLYYFSARYLDPVTGRFLTADDGPAGSIDRQDTFNAYAYAFDAPTSLIDPTGHAPQILGGLVVLGKGIAKVGSMLGKAALKGAAVAKGMGSSSQLSIAMASGKSAATTKSVTAGTKSLLGTSAVSNTTRVAGTSALAKSTPTQFKYVAFRTEIGTYRVAPMMARGGMRGPMSPMYKSSLTTHSSRGFATSAGKGGGVKGGGVKGGAHGGAGKAGGGAGGKVSASIEKGISKKLLKADRSGGLLAEFEKIVSSGKVVSAKSTHVAGIKKLSGDGYKGFMYQAKPVVSSKFSKYRLYGNMEGDHVVFNFLRVK